MDKHSKYDHTSRAVSLDAHHERKRHGIQKHGHHSPNHGNSKEKLDYLRRYSRIVVFGLLEEQTQSDLREMFRPFGTILRVTVVRDHKTRVSKGYGFVNFANPNEAALAKKYWDGVALGSGNIQINYAHGPDGRWKSQKHKEAYYRPCFRRSSSPAPDKSLKGNTFQARN